MIDLDVHRLPDALSLPSYVVGAALLVTAALSNHQPVRLLHAAIGMAALYAFYYVLMVANLAAWDSATSSWPASWVLSRLPRLGRAGRRRLPGLSDRRGSWRDPDGARPSRSKVSHPVRAVHDRRRAHRDLRRADIGPRVHARHRRVIAPVRRPLAFGQSGQSCLVWSNLVAASRSSHAAIWPMPCAERTRRVRRGTAGKPSV